MNLTLGSKPIGARLLSAASVPALLLMSMTSIAQDALPSGISPEVVNVLLETRSQRPAAQATPQERAAAVDELRNIYAISNLPEANELASEPGLKAQLDLQRRVLIFNAFATTYMQNNQPTDQEIFDTYQEQIALAPTDEYKARHILVDAQGAALSLIAELDAGAEFATLAEQHSTGPSSTSGGDLGWFPANAMVKAFSDAVAVLENGSYTKAPVQTQFGWHIIFREDSRIGNPPPLESVRDVIAQRITQDKLLTFIGTLHAKPAE